MLDYIPIERVLQRLGTIDPSYEIEKRTEALTQEGNRWTIFVSVDLLLFGRNVAGVGSGTSNDPDMAYKTAMSEAIKNAAKNGWHVGLYLWDEEERDLVAQQRADGSREGVKPPTRRVKSPRGLVARPSGDDFGGFEG